MLERDFYLTNGFERDVKKHHLALVSQAWADIVNCLATNSPMPEKYKDHALTNNWAGFRDCHVKPDLVLIYKIVDNVVELHHLNSHSEIFG